jgi:hypothetical protein
MCVRTARFSKPGRLIGIIYEQIPRSKSEVRNLLIIQTTSVKRFLFSISVIWVFGFRGSSFGIFRGGNQKES